MFNSVHKSRVLQGKFKNFKIVQYDLKNTKLLTFNT